jgi:hypothetical protein
MTLRQCRVRFADLEIDQADVDFDCFLEQSEWRCIFDRNKINGGGMKYKLGARPLMNPRNVAIREKRRQTEFQEKARK